MVGEYHLSVAHAFAFRLLPTWNERHYPPAGWSSISGKSRRGSREHSVPSVAQVLRPVRGDRQGAIVNRPWIDFFATATDRKRSTSFPAGGRIGRPTPSGRPTMGGLCRQWQAAGDAAGSKHLGGSLARRRE